MAFINFRVGPGNDGNFGALFQDIDQTAANRTDGWTVAKIAAGNSCEFDAGTKQLSTAFTSQTTTPKPASFLTGTTANAFKTPTALTGTFTNDVWLLRVAIRATTASGQFGRARYRVFRSVNADGSAATEITASTQFGGTTFTISTTADATSTVSWSPGTAISLNNEYLFFAVAWEITTAGGSNSCDIVPRTGAASNTGSYFSPSDFTAGGGAAAVKKPRVLSTSVPVMRAALR